MRKELLFLRSWVAVIPGRGSTFYAIGPDPNTFVPDQLVSVTLAPQSVCTLATLGGGLFGFNGGLTVGPGGVLYAIANDFTGAGSLYTVQPDGTLGFGDRAKPWHRLFRGWLTTIPTACFTAWETTARVFRPSGPISTREGRRYLCLSATDRQREAWS